MHHTFLCISFPFLHDYEVKMPTIEFYGDRKQATTKLTTPENTITYHNVLFCHPKFCINIVFNFPWELKCPQEKLKTMPMQIFGVANKEHYGMLCYFLEWSILFLFLNLDMVPCNSTSRGFAYILQSK